MLVLREMHLREYPAYRQYFIDDYSREIATNYGYSMERAINMASEELTRSFPQGPVSNQHDLLSIEAEHNNQLVLVGYLWHSKNSHENSSYIYDFYILDEYRGRGFGKLAINKLEAQLQGEGIKQIKLRVAFDNKRALQLYQSAGFIITGHNMLKNIEPKSESAVSETTK